MTNQNDRSPARGKSTFICPHCNDSTQQNWELWKLRKSGNGDFFSEELRLLTAECIICSGYSIWRGNKMIYPLASFAPKPDNNMPEPVRELYEEASLVSIHSSRAAAALLRVALEKLTEHLGEPDGNLNKRIGNLQKKGLPDSVIKSLDIVRITANSGGAHAGIIDLTGADGADIVNRLFWLINYIVQKTITDPAEINKMFGDLPEVKRKGAEDRDKPKETQ